MYIWMYIDGMARRYSISEARAHLAEIVRAAEAGAIVELTRRGEPIAVVASPSKLASSARFAEAYASFVARHDLARDGISEGYTDELRDRGEGREVDL